MRLYFNAYALHKNVRTCNYLQLTFKYILHGLMIPPPSCYNQEIVSDSFHVVSAGSPWLSLVILGYPWLSLCYLWLSMIPIYVKSFAHLQLFFSSFAEIFLQFPCSFRWFPLVIAGYPWLPLVIPMLSLVIYDSNICEIVCAFAIIFLVICRNLLAVAARFCNHKVTCDNQGEPAELDPAIVQIPTTSIEEGKRITHTFYALAEIVF